MMFVLPTMLAAFSLFTCLVYSIVLMHKMLLLQTVICLFHDLTELYKSVQNIKQRNNVRLILVYE